MNYNVLKSNQKWFKDKNLILDGALEEISVMECDQLVNECEQDEDLFQLNSILSGWYAVADTDGVNAYFSTETEALAYRLFLINRILNG